MIGSVILALHFMGIVPLESAINALYITGVLLIIAEIGVVSFGLLALNGLLAIYAGYVLQAGPVAYFGIEVGWSLFFAVAFVEFLVLFAGIFVVRKIREQKTQTGAEGMIGQKAKVIEWSGTEGKVNFEGENWTAQSDKEMDLHKGDTVTILSVKKLHLTITA